MPSARLATDLRTASRTRRTRSRTRQRALRAVGARPLPLHRQRAVARRSGPGEFPRPSVRTPRRQRRRRGGRGSAPNVHRRALRAHPSPARRAHRRRDRRAAVPRTRDLTQRAPPSTSARAKCLPTSSPPVLRTTLRPKPPNALTRVIVHITVGRDTQIQKQDAQAAHGTRRRTTPASRSPRGCARHPGPAQCVRRPGRHEPPRCRLYTLKGDLAGFRAVTVRATWRIVFHFEDGHAVDVDCPDYH